MEKTWHHHEARKDYQFEIQEEINAQFHVFLKLGYDLEFFIFPVPKRSD